MKCTIFAQCFVTKQTKYLQIYSQSEQNAEAKKNLYPVAQCIIMKICLSSNNYEIRNV